MLKEITKNETAIKDLLCGTIKQRRLINFYYESKTGGNKERIVEPYIIGIKDNGKGNIFLAALPKTELIKPIEYRKLRHYLLSKMDIDKIKVLNETYDEPHVERHRITHTPTIKAICNLSTRMNKEVATKITLMRCTTRRLSWHISKCSLLYTNKKNL